MPLFTQGMKRERSRLYHITTTIQHSLCETITRLIWQPLVTQWTHSSKYFSLLPAKINNSSTMMKRSHILIPRMFMVKTACLEQHIFRILWTINRLWDLLTSRKWSLINKTAEQTRAIQSRLRDTKLCKPMLQMRTKIATELVLLTKITRYRVFVKSWKTKRMLLSFWAMIHCIWAPITCRRSLFMILTIDRSQIIMIHKEWRQRCLLKLRRWCCRGREINI